LGRYAVGSDYISNLSVFCVNTIVSLLAQ
jgi:hypothetical protein